MSKKMRIIHNQLKNNLILCTKEINQEVINKSSSMIIILK